MEGGGMVLWMMGGLMTSEVEYMFRLCAIPVICDTYNCDIVYMEAEYEHWCWNVYYC